MDAVLFLGIAIVLTIMSLYKTDTNETGASTEIIKEDIERTAKLNDAYYEDAHAFLEIANALGFPKGV